MKVLGEIMTKCKYCDSPPYRGGGILIGERDKPRIRVCSSGDCFEMAQWELIVLKFIRKSWDNLWSPQSYLTPLSD